MYCSKLHNEHGFTLIELMIVVAIIGILAAIAIPNFLGMQEKAKRRAVEEISASAKSELHNWMSAAEKNEPGVVDVNGDGSVDSNELHTSLFNVPDSWLQAMIRKKGATPTSPWNGNKALLTVGAPAVGNTGQITLSLLNNGRGVKILALDMRGMTLFSDSVSIE